MKLGVSVGGGVQREVGGGTRGKDIRQEKVEPLKKMSNHVLRNSFHQKGLREQSHPLFDTEQSSSPGPRAFPAILITHNENFEKSFPTSKLTTISESEAGFLFPFAAHSVQTIVI